MFLNVNFAFIIAFLFLFPKPYRHNVRMQCERVRNTEMKKKNNKKKTEKKIKNKTKKQKQQIFNTILLTDYRFKKNKTTLLFCMSNRQHGHFFFGKIINSNSQSRKKLYGYENKNIYKFLIFQSK